MSRTHQVRTSVAALWISRQEACCRPVGSAVRLKMQVPVFYEKGGDLISYVYLLLLFACGLGLMVYSNFFGWKGDIR